MANILFAFTSIFACLWCVNAVQNRGLPGVNQVLESHNSETAELDSAGISSAQAQTVGFSLGRCTTDKDCFAAGENLRCCPVGENLTAPGGCPAKVTAHAVTEEHVSVCQLPSQKFHLQKALCGCVRPTQISCLDGPPWNWPYKPAKRGLKQWLLIGDSVSQGISRHVRINGTAMSKFKVQISHIPVNGLNSRFGKRCVKEWLDDPKRWDLISFNFGIHDIAHNTERLEPEDYANTLKDIARQLKFLAPKAEVVFATTTPTPEDCGPTSNCRYAKDGFTDLTEGLAAQVVALNDPTVYDAADPPLYNDAAVKALATLPFKVSIADLYRRVTATCGERFETCPTDCDKAGWEKVNTECYIYPGDVHYTRRGYLDLASEYIDTVVKALGLM